MNFMLNKQMFWGANITTQLTTILEFLFVSIYNMYIRLFSGSYTEQKYSTAYMKTRFTIELKSSVIPSILYIIASYHRQ